VPCGACHALVPVTGCTHWRPLIAAHAAQTPEAVRRRAHQQRARQDAVERVAEFRRVMKQ